MMLIVSFAGLLKWRSLAQAMVSACMIIMVM
jgi:hypothetical protein